MLLLLRLVAIASFAMAFACVPRVALAQDVITVGAAGSCTRDTIQGAIDLARSRPGPQEIRVTRNTVGTVIDGTWEHQALTIDDMAVTIVGGFDDCADTTPDGRTTIAGAGGARAPVLTTRNGVVVDLRHLALVGGDADGDRGGGIDFRGAGTLALVDVRVERSIGGDGGGIHVDGTTGATTLLLQRDVAIVGNESRHDGGGIFARGATADTPVTVMLGDDIEIRHNASRDAFGGAGGGIHLRDHAVLAMQGRRNAVHHNTAAFGGGVYVLAPARATIAASPADPPLGTIFDNDAAFGGGVMATTIAGTGHDTVLRLFAIDVDAPFSLARNQARASGGALYLAGDPASAGEVSVCARHVVIVGNAAPDGAAIHARSAGVRINDALCAMPPDAAPACAPDAGATCNVIADNAPPDGMSAMGATVALDGGAYGRLFGLTFRGNAATSAIATGGASPTRIDVRDALLHGNVLSKAVIDLAAPTLDVGNAITRATIAMNDDAGRVVRVARDTGLAMRDTLVDQPGRLLAFAEDASAPLDLRDVMDTAPGPLPPDAVVLDAAPVYDADADAPFTQATASPGVDVLPALGGLDRYGRPRDVDLPDIDHGGPRDIGAVETPDRTRAPLVFCDGFEGAAPGCNVASSRARPPR